MLYTSLAVAALSLGAAAKRHQPGSPSAPHYDFVIIGGGTSGLTIANRLSELQHVTVAVIEAGESALNNFNVTNVMGYSTAFGTQVDWAYQTESQTYAGGMQQIIRAGKALGGTSTINGKTLPVHF